MAQNTGVSMTRVPMSKRLVVATGLILVVSAWSEAPAQSDRSEDLAVFDEQFLQVEQSYTGSTRAQAMERFAVLKEVSDRLSDAEFELALAEITALAGNGHTRVFVGRWAEAFNRLGVRFLIADDGLHIADAIPEYESLVGTQVLSVAGQNLDALRETWARYYQGRAGYRDNALYLFIESPELLQAAGVSESTRSVELTLEGGSTVEVGVTDEWPVPQGVWRLMPRAREIELMEAGRVRGNPLYLQEPGAFFRFVELPETGIVYLQFRANSDFGGEADMRQQAGEALQRLQSLGPRTVVVDQRFNFGGNLNNTRDLMQAIPEIVGLDGRVFALTSGRTFSAGIASVGYLKQAGGDRVTIIGAPIGDFLEFWAEGSPIVLPQSGAIIGVATERHNYRTGCPEEDCHGSIRRHPIRVESLEPDVEPTVTYADVVSGADPYLEAALQSASATR